MPFLIMMVVIFAIMWFFMIRPQQKRQKEIQNFRNSITRGQQIVTAGGIYGTVKDIDEAAGTLKVEIASGICSKVDRNSVFANARTCCSETRVTNCSSFSSFLLCPLAFGSCKHSTTHSTTRCRSACNSVTYPRT